MSEAFALPASRGRPSRHPSRVAYHESPEVVDALRAAAADNALSLSETHRLVTRLGLAALRSSQMASV